VETASSVTGTPAVSRQSNDCGVRAGAPDVRAPQSLKVLTEGLRFPEGPVPLPDGSVLVVEIAGAALTRVAPDGSKRVLAELEGGPNGAALGPDGWVYICNSGGWKYTREANGWQRPTGQAAQPGWIERISLANGAVQRLYERCGRQRLRAPNDLVFDRHGGFYFTDHGKRKTRAYTLGGLYYALADGTGIVEVVAGMFTPNGVGLSDDGGTVYVAETVTRRVWAFDVIEPGRVRSRRWPSPSGGRLVAGLPDASYPDSMAVDGRGNICVATFNHAGIWQIAPDGSRLAFVPLPDFYTTNIAFGGPGLRTAFVTQSCTGKLVSFEWNVPGQPLPYLNPPSGGEAAA
jgi:gluconolactonase